MILMLKLKSVKKREISRRRTMKDSKELEGILNAIEKWCKKHKGNVQFVGSFMAFKGEDFEIFDDRILAYGVKDTIKIDLKELTKQINKEKDFVNW